MELDNSKIHDIISLETPYDIKKEYRLSVDGINTVLNTRKAIQDILTGKDKRLIVVVGPCSIHDIDTALDYSKRLKCCIDKYKRELLIIMRVYFEKPRTTIGWKGFINDPDLDDSYNINMGISLARKLLTELNNNGIPCATEFLDVIVPQYISDCISWGAIGARTVESQLHRQMASGLSMPIGFKNSTDGNIQVAIDAIQSAKSEHVFLGITEHGKAAIVKTKGNDSCHVILRGSTNGPNYDTRTITEINKKNSGIKIMIDCSHGNSGKDFNRQPHIVDDICKQILFDKTEILGVMIESHIYSGNQKLIDKRKLQYGISITDSCIDWETTEIILEKLAQLRI